MLRPLRFPAASERDAAEIPKNTESSHSMPTKLPARSLRNSSVPSHRSCRQPATAIPTAALPRPRTTARDHRRRQFTYRPVAEPLALLPCTEIGTAKVPTPTSCHPRSLTLHEPIACIPATQLPCCPARKHPSVRQARPHPNSADTPSRAALLQFAKLSNFRIFRRDPTEIIWN